MYMVSLNVYKDSLKSRFMSLLFVYKENLTWDAGVY